MVILTCVHVHRLILPLLSHRHGALTTDIHAVAGTSGSRSVMIHLESVLEEDQMAVQLMIGDSTLLLETWSMLRLGQLVALLWTMQRP